MKCKECGADLPLPEFPEFENWKEFMDKQLTKNLNKEQYNANQKRNTQKISA